MGDRGRVRSWVVGCGALLGLFLLLVATVGGLTWRSVSSADRQSPTLVHDPPAVEVATPEGGEGDALKVLLELDSCEVYIEPAAAGEPLSVEAHYDAHDYRLEEIVGEESADSYRLRFLVTSSRLITAIKQGLRGGQPQLRVRLPVDRPIELKLVQRNGGAIVDLSGLHLVDAEFDAGGALLKVDADAPLEGRLERFAVKGDQGGFLLESLSLIRPERIELDFRMGEAQLDFRGAWASDTTVQLSASMADTILRLPRDARIVGLDTDREIPSFSDTEIPPPTLTFDVESGRRATLRVFE